MQKTDGIRIPGVILDELKTLDYSQDERFSIAEGKKRKRGNGKHMSRKEKRKMERAEKKRKSIPNREGALTGLKPTSTFEKRRLNAGNIDVVKQVNGRRSVSSDESETNENSDSDDQFSNEGLDEGLKIDGDKAMSVEETMKELKILKLKKKKWKNS